MNLPFFNSPYAIYYSFSSLISSPMGFIGILQLYKLPCVQHNTTQKQRLIKKRGQPTIAHSTRGLLALPSTSNKPSSYPHFMYTTPFSRMYYTHVGAYTFVIFLVDKFCENLLVEEYVQNVFQICLIFLVPNIQEGKTMQRQYFLL